MGVVRFVPEGHVTKHVTKPKPDPFFVAPEVGVHGALAYALSLCIPAHLADRIGIICNPATQPRSVIGATTDRECCHCGQAVWVAPSSKRVEREHVFICLTCIEDHMRNL
jgi:hypothetical protein